MQENHFSPFLILRLHRFAVVAQISTGTGSPGAICIQPVLQSG